MTSGTTSHKLPKVKLTWGDCLEEMRAIPDGCIDMILADPPYGTTECKWDSVINLDLMWEQLNRVIRANGAIVMTASQPFTTALIVSNMKTFKYCWVWEKTRPSGFVHAKNKPLKSHEDVVIWSSGTTVHASQSKNRMTYNPQGLKDCGEYTYRPNRDKSLTRGTIRSRPSHKKGWVQEKKGYPRTVLKFPNPNNRTSHPTQKPVALMEYLISTYTYEGEMVLDFAMGSGTTGMACVNVHRNFIGIEKDEGYFKMAEERIYSNLFGVGDKA